MLQKTGISLFDIATPKLGADDPSRLFYKYYAGFSEAFVEDTLRFLGVTPGQKLLDPWNGAGTTTAVAASHQLDAYGYDLNPALVVIAKARAVEPKRAQQILRMLSYELKRRRHIESELNELDPLLRWFGEQSVHVIRGVEELLRSKIQKATSPSALANSLSDELALLRYRLILKSSGMLSFRARSNGSSIEYLPRSSLCCFRLHSQIGSRTTHQRIFSAVKPLRTPNHGVRQRAARSRIRCHNDLYFKGLTASAVIAFLLLP